MSSANLFRRYKHGGLKSYMSCSYAVCGMQYAAPRPTPHLKARPSLLTKEWYQNKSVLP